MVFADADLKLAAGTIAAAAFGQAGQRCTATSRVVAVREVADALIERLADRARTLRLGPGGEPDTDVGPLVSAGHRDSVQKHLEAAIKDGTTVHAGNHEPPGADFVSGCLVARKRLRAVRPPWTGKWRRLPRRASAIARDRGDHPGIHGPPAVGKRSGLGTRPFALCPAGRAATQHHAGLPAARAPQAAAHPLGMRIPGSVRHR